VIGADAGYSCFLAGGAVELAPPQWLASGEAPQANVLLAEALFAAFGFRVIGVADLGATVTIESPGKPDKTRLLLPLGGISAVLGEVEAFRVMSGDGTPLLDVAGPTLAEAREARESVRDLAILGPLLSDAERTGHDPGEALMRILTVR
jgi:hypothetical protein